MASTLKQIPLKQIRENPIALRKVNRQTETYLGLVDSIRQQGILNPINVREIATTNGETIYGLIDGLHRFTAAGDAGLDSIPAQVLSLNDAEVLEAQVIANIHKVETKPVEYARQLIRILMQNPTMTSAELAKKLAKSPTWLADRLGLTKLDESIGTLVDEGKINLSNAYALSKLPKEEQSNFLERAMTESPQMFLPAVQNRTKEIRDAKRQGRTPPEEGFQPHPYIRRVGELKAELDHATLGPVLIKKFGAKTAEEGFVLALKWALSLDPDSVELQKEKADQRKAEHDRQKELRKKERLENQAKEAQAKVKEMEAKAKEDAAKAGAAT